MAGSEAPIIILTAYDWSDIEKEARDAGVTAFCARVLDMELFYGGAGAVSEVGTIIKRKRIGLQKDL